MLPAVWHSPRLSVWPKLQATVHLTQYAIAVPMILVALVGRPAAADADGRPLAGVDSVAVHGVPAGGGGACIAYMNARYVIGGGIPGPLRILKLMVLGLGLCVNNGVAVLTGLVQNGGEFVRTPKSGSTTQKRRAPMPGLRSRLWIFELLLGVYCLAHG